LVFTLAGGLIFFFFGQVSSLECARVQTDNLNCILLHTLVGFTIKEQPINELNNARVVERRDSDGDLTYKIILETGQGDISLTTYSSSGMQNKVNLIELINAFLEDSQEQKLSVQYGGGLSLLLPFIFVLLGMLEIFVGIKGRYAVWHIDKVEHLLAHYRKGLFGTKVTQYSLDEITGATVASSHNSDGDRTYRIDFITKNGERIPMTSWYSSGYKKKQETAAVIRDFLGENTLT